MIKSNVMSREISNERWQAFFISRPFLIGVAMIVLPLGGIGATLLGNLLGVPGFYIWGAVIGAIIMAIVIALRQDELAAILVIAIHIYIDWYWGLEFVAQLMEFALLLIFFLGRSPRSPWAEPRAFWLWVLLIVLAIFPATRGMFLIDTINYYCNIFFGSLTIFWLGLLIARDTVSVQRLFKMLGIFGTLIAIHAIIQAVTGVVLFATSRFDAYFAQISYYELVANSNVYRAGSFLVNPDSAGSFFAIMLFIPLGLFVKASSFLEKLFYLVQVFLILVALLFTYSTGGWAAACIGIVAFMVFVGRIQYRIQLPMFILIVVIAIIMFFPAQVELQIQHAIAPHESSLRFADWQTGLRVISAYPLTGIGLGRYVYLVRAEPYRVLAQYKPEAHPHNSYIEIGALGGLPVLAVFIALLAFITWLALRNWSRADAPTRSLLAGGLAAVITLSANSMVVNGWTLIPLSAIGWLILGVLSSPLLAKNLNREVVKEENQPDNELLSNCAGEAKHVYANRQGGK